MPKPCHFGDRAASSVATSQHRHCSRLDVCGCESRMFPCLTTETGCHKAVSIQGNSRSSMKKCLLTPWAQAG